MNARQKAKHYKRKYSELKQEYGTKRVKLLYEKKEIAYIQSSVDISYEDRYLMREKGIENKYIANKLIQGMEEELIKNAEITSYENPYDMRSSTRYVMTLAVIDRTR